MPDNTLHLIEEIKDYIEQEIVLALGSNILCCSYSISKEEEDGIIYLMSLIDNKNKNDDISFDNQADMVQTEKTGREDQTKPASYIRDTIKNYLDNPHKVPISHFIKVIEDRREPDLRRERYFNESDDEFIKICIKLRIIEYLADYRTKRKKLSENKRLQILTPEWLKQHWLNLLENELHFCKIMIKPLNAQVQTWDNNWFSSGELLIGLASFVHFSTYLAMFATFYTGDENSYKCGAAYWASSLFLIFSTLNMCYHWIDIPKGCNIAKVLFSNRYSTGDSTKEKKDGIRDVRTYLNKKIGESECQIKIMKNEIAASNKPKGFQFSPFGFFASTLKSVFDSVPSWKHLKTKESIVTEAIQEKPVVTKPMQEKYYSSSLERTEIGYALRKEESDILNGMQLFK